MADIDSGLNMTLGAPLPPVSLWDEVQNFFSGGMFGVSPTGEVGLATRVGNSIDDYEEAATETVDEFSDKFSNISDALPSATEIFAGAGLIILALVLVLLIMGKVDAL